MIKVGIIGTGFSAHSQLEALRRLPHVEVVAIAGSSKEKAEQKAAQFGIPKAYGDALQLIHDPEVEVVHNCTPNHLHYQLNRQTLLAGKHLLSEKPLAMNSEESYQLSELAKKSPGVSGVCFNYRHYPLIAQARNDLASGKYGKVKLVYGGYLQDWLLYEIDYNWRLEADKNGASRAIADIGSHWLDTVQYVLGRKVVEVFADLKTVHPTRKKAKNVNGQVEWEEVEISTEDYGSVLVHFEDGIHGAFTISQVSAGRKNMLHFEIAAEKAALAWNQEKPNRLWIGKRDQANEVLLRDPSLLSPEAAAIAHYPGGHQEGWPDGLKNLFIDFYAVVHAKKTNGKLERPSSFATISDGHQIMLLIDGILESHQSKKWVQVNR